MNKVTVGARRLGENRRAAGTVERRDGRGGADGHGMWPGAGWSGSWGAVRGECYRDHVLIVYLRYLGLGFWVP